MGKYSDKLVNQYIMGVEIVNVEELENSKSFMVQAIDKSGDYRLYDLCSDRLKKNFAFVKYLVLKFANNIDFICRIADYFLEKSVDKFSKIELVVLMIDLVKNNKEKYMYYLMYGHALYCFKRLQIEATKKKFDDQEFVDDLGMGFLLIFEEYNHNKDVLGFFAKKIIDEIFDEFDIDLECMLHDEFDDPDKINNIGLNNYMLNFIGYYDSMLSNYLCTHIELLDNFRKRIMKVQNNWERFKMKNERDKYYLMFNRVHEYLSDKDSLIGETCFLYYVGEKFGIENKICKYDDCYNSLVEALRDVDKEFINEALNCSFEERIYLNNIKKIMMETVLSKNNRELVEKNKVLKIDFKQKKNNE